MYPKSSDVINSVDSAFIYIVSISVVILLGVTIAMIYFVIKYNRKRNAVATDIEGNFWLEVTWITIPTLLALSMFYVGFSSFKVLRTIPENAMEIEVKAQMWKWNFIYENGKTTDTLWVPINQPIKLNLSSIDVTHSFYIPAYRIKEDAVPGVETYLAFTPDKLGSYQVECAEYCGLQHSYMLTKVNVIPEDEFVRWINTKNPQSDSANAAISNSGSVQTNSSGRANSNDSSASNPN